MDESRLSGVGQFMLLVLAAVLGALAAYLYFVQPGPSVVGIGVCAALALLALGFATLAPKRLHFALAQWFVWW